MEQFLIDLTNNNILSYIIIAALPLVFIVPYALYAIYGERKVSAFMQDRVGPNRVGPYGLLQTVTDILKLMQKEDIIPTRADKILFIIGPYLIFVGSYTAYAAIPFSSHFIGSNINMGILFILAFSSLSVPAILMGGWAGNNKYSLYGAMRSVSQIVSYEIPAFIVVITMIMAFGTLSLNELSINQTQFFWNWNILGGPGTSLTKFLLIPFMIVGFIIFYISSLAEVNRTPFDIPEAESELVGGFHTEYAGMKWAMYMLAEYGNMFLVSAIVTCLFFGGWQSPFGYLGNSLNLPWLIPFETLFWFILKGFFFVFVQMWLRWTLPRLRVDQLMVVCWKYLIPYAFINLIIVGIITLL